MFVCQIANIFYSSLKHTKCWGVCYHDTSNFWTIFLNLFIKIIKIYISLFITIYRSYTHTTNTCSCWVCSMCWSWDQTQLSFMITTWSMISHNCSESSKFSISSRVWLKWNLFIVCDCWKHNFKLFYHIIVACSLIFRCEWM